MMLGQVVRLLRNFAKEKSDVIEATKRNSERFGMHSDWPWNGIILSAATRGGSARWENNVAPRYERELSWRALEGLTANNLRQRLLTVGRFKNKTADWLEPVYNRITDEGGAGGVRAKLLNMTAMEIIAFWKSFKDIKDKYARNIMMDVYHPDFRASFFAIDSRILTLLPALGYAGPKAYEQQEAFLRNLAIEVGIEAWELDRLLYQGQKELLKALQTAQNQT